MDAQLGNRILAIVNGFLEHMLVCPYVHCTRDVSVSVTALLESISSAVLWRIAPLA